MYEPLYRHRPRHRWTNGDLAAKVGADLGLPPDEEQRWILDTIYGERATDRPSSFEVAVISPRQNIKTSTLGIAALADLFVFGVERHLWTAHHGDTLKGTFNDFREWIKSNPEYDEQVTFYEGHQDMSIKHKETGNVIDFQSRTGKAGRGLTGVKRITLDEALYLEPKHVGAVYPTMLTRPEAQVRIGSSAGLLMSEQLRRIRDRGRAGKDKRLAYVEYGAELKACASASCSHTFGADGCVLDDRDLWWQANCALWAGRITEESLADQRQSMPPDEFMREFLSWWEDPSTSGLALPNWNAHQIPAGDQPTNSLTLGVSVALDQSWSCIGAAAVWESGAAHVGVSTAADGQLDYRPGTAWLTARLKDMQERHGCKVVMDSKCPDADLAERLREAGVTVDELTTEEMLEAFSGLMSDVAEGTLTHFGQPVLDAAVRAAVLRYVGDRPLPGRKQSGADISALEAVTIARHVALSSNYDVLDSIF